MKKFLAFLLIATIMMQYTVFSKDIIYSEIHKSGVSLCYKGDVYSADYVYSVPNGTSIISVSLDVPDCIYDWNYVEDEAKLYLSLASANPIPKSDIIATIELKSNSMFFIPDLVTINGNIIKSGMDVFHKSVPMEWVSPGIDTPGQCFGEMCPECGIVVIEPEVIPPKGAKVNASITADGTLTVSGALSDNTVAEGTTSLAVYNKDKRMLTLANITDQDQSDFSISIENMKDAHTVKVLRWAMPSLRPLHNAVEVNVTSK